MCSFNWRQFDSHISIFFNRDESVLRPKAELPQIFNDGNGDFLMPKDPVGSGSWIAANQFGYVFLLLNDYQGLLKQDNAELQSRGLIIRGLASCQTEYEVLVFIRQIDLTSTQPFHLVVISALKQTCWHYDGVKTELVAKALPQQIYSSGHPDAEKIIKLRTDYVSLLNPKTDEALLDIHQSHQPQLSVDEHINSENEMSYPICMHRKDAKTQSLTHIVLAQDKLQMAYWDGQPCSTDQCYRYELDLS